MANKIAEATDAHNQFAQGKIFFSRWLATHTSYRLEFQEIFEGNILASRNAN